MLTVVLWGLSGPAAVGVILPMASGVRWTNQSGGYSCRHPTCEGVWLPLGLSVSDAEALSAAFIESHGESPTEAEVVAMEAALPRWVRVDQSRLAESQEAWIWVVIERPPADTMTVRIDDATWPIHGILTWENSD